MYFSWGFLRDNKFKETNKRDGEVKSHILFVSKNTKRFNPISDIGFVCLGDIVEQFLKNDYEIIGENLYKMLCPTAIYVFNISMEDEAGYILSGNFTERNAMVRTRLIKFQFDYADTLEKSYLKENLI